MGFIRVVNFGLISYGYLNLYCKTKGFHNIVTKGEGTLGILTRAVVSFCILVMILGFISRRTFCSGGRKITEGVNSIRSALLSVLIPIEVMVGCCYCSSVFHNLENLKGVKIDMHSKEMIFAVFTAVCQHMLPLMGLIFEIPRAVISRSSIHIPFLIMFGGLVCLYGWRHPENDDLYFPWHWFDKLGPYGKIISYSKVIVIPVIAYELMMKIVGRKKVVAPPKEKIKRN